MNAQMLTHYPSIKVVLTTEQVRTWETSKLGTISGTIIKISGDRTTDYYSFLPTFFCLYPTFHDEHILLGEKATIKDL